MIRNDTYRHVPFVFFLIFFSRQFADSAPQRLNRIHVKNRIHILHDGRQALQAHSGIDIFLLQLAVIALPVIVKLGKYIVPHFDIAVTIAAYRTFRLAAAVFLPTVIINLRTGTAGAGTVFPEIVFLSKAENPLLRNADFFIPYVKSFIVFQINGRIETLRIQSDHFRQKFPAPPDRILFKIIPKGKIPQHFKKCPMSRCLADIFNVPGTDTFLAGRHSLPRWYLLAGKIRL